MTYAINTPEKKHLYQLKQKQKIESKRKSFLMDIKHENKLTENDLLLVKRRLNNNTYKYEDIQEFNNLKLSEQQQEKGYNWLMAQYKTPTGQIKSNSPFGYREKEILDNKKEIIFQEFTDLSGRNQYGFHNYQPIYKVIAKDGSSFEYYIKDGEIVIIG